MKSSVLLKSYQVIALPSETPVAASPRSACTLRWRNRILWVRAARGESPFPVPALENEQWLVDCLGHSGVRAVCLDPALGEETILFWADACHRAGKTAILRVPSGFPRIGRNFPAQLVKGVLDRVVAAFLLLVISPLALALAYSIRVTSPGPLFFRQWRVGEKGRLFEILKFRSMVADAEQQHHQVMGDRSGLHKRQDDPRITRSGRWMRRYSLDELPQLVNVLRGELSLVGPRPWALYDALRLDSPARKRLKALPGITGLWQVTGRSEIRDLEAVSHYDLEYLRGWTLWGDFKILLRTIPAVLRGFGAY